MALVLKVKANRLVGGDDAFQRGLNERHNLLKADRSHVEHTALTTLRGTSSKNTGNNCDQQRTTIPFLTRSLIEDNRRQRGPNRGSPWRAFPSDGEKSGVSRGSIIYCETMSSCQLRGQY